MAEDYTITGQGQGSAIGPGGGIIDTWDVSFTTMPEGIQARVQVPLAEWMADPVGSVASRIEPLIGPIKATETL